MDGSVLVNSERVPQIARKAMKAATGDRHEYHNNEEIAGQIHTHYLAPRYDEMTI